MGEIILVQIFRVFIILRSCVQFPLNFFSFVLFLLPFIEAFRTRISVDPSIGVSTKVSYCPQLCLTISYSLWLTVLLLRMTILLCAWLWLCLAVLLLAALFCVWLSYSMAVIHLPYCCQSFHIFLDVPDLALGRWHPAPLRRLPAPSERTLLNLCWGFFDSSRMKDKKEWIVDRMIHAVSWYPHSCWWYSR